MAGDLHDRLRAAIEARKALAEDLERRSPSAPWRAFGDWVACFVDQHNCAGGTAESAYMHEPHCGYEPMFRSSDDLAAHIAANDPATVIRHCERDLKVLERHRVSRYGRCCQCMDGGHYLPAPCPEIRDLAEAYGIPPTPENGETT